MQKMCWIIFEHFLVYLKSNIQKIPSAYLDCPMCTMDKNECTICFFFCKMPVFMSMFYTIFTSKSSKKLDRRRAKGQSYPL